MFLEERVARLVFAELLAQLVQALVFADGDVLHLLRDDALPRVPELGHRVAGAGAERAAAGFHGKLHEPLGPGGVRLGKVAVILRNDGAPLVLLHVAALQDPVLADARQALLDIALEAGIAPGAAGIVNADGGVGFDLAAHRLGMRERDLAHGHAQAGVDAALQVNAAAVGQGLGALRFDGVFGSDHKK